MPLPGVNVVLYSDENSYNQNANLPAGNSTTGKISATDGTVVFDSIPANTEHWLLATFVDTNNVLNSNQGLSSKINQLVPGSVIDMEVTVAPLSANIAFYTAASVNIPIYVRLDAIPKDSITSINSNPALITASSTGDAVVFAVNEGAHYYQAYTKAGCTWTGKIDVTNGGFIKHPFDMCNLASATFYFYDNAPTSSVNSGPYDVLVDNIKVGTLNDIYTGGPPSAVCGLNDNIKTVTAYVEAGQTHSYQIRSATSTCTWINTMGPLVPGQCTEIGIPKVSGNSCP